MFRAALRLYSPSIAPSRMNQVRRYWRDATSVILAAKCDGALQGSPGLAPSRKTDYDVLMLTRSRKSKFLSERVVFPGGVLDEEDFQENWKQIFEDCTNKPFSELETTFRVHGGQRPPIILSRQCGGTGTLPPDFGLRIAAIRETFEETGILLVRAKLEFTTSTGTTDTVATTSMPVKMHMLPKSSGLKKWRERVRRHPGDFQKLCQELNVVPNVWALKEWSNWLTPAWKTEPEPPLKPHRFEAMFYLCCLDETPKASADEMEVYSPRWSNPQSFLQQSNQPPPGGVRIADPQIYELSRLRRYETLDELCQFAARRQEKGVQRMVTALVLCADGRVHALNGDDFHPEKMDPTKSALLTSTKTIAQLGAGARHLNRIEWRNSEGVPQ